MQNQTRRTFIKSAAALAGASFAPNILLGQDKAAKPLNVAAVGCGGKGWSDISEISKGNRIAFLCDVDKNIAGKAIGNYADAKYFSDYREMFASVAGEIDVVTVSTPDHMHFPIALEAIRLGKPVFVQKPLCNNLWETRVLADMARKNGVLTVMGNQGATMAGTRILREWIEAGLIGEVKEVHYWTNRPIWPQGPGLTFPAEPVPEHINWDVWQGTCATERPYNKNIHPFKWRGFWD
jgi:predicted dehydrogenase